MAFARTIIEEPAVTETLTEFQPRFPRLDQMWEGWKWRLCRDPVTDAFHIPPDDYLIRTPYYNAFNLPLSLLILYQFNPDEINILSIRVDLYAS